LSRSYSMAEASRLGETASPVLFDPQANTSEWRDSYTGTRRCLRPCPAGNREPALGRSSCAAASLSMLPQPIGGTAVQPELTSLCGGRATAEAAIARTSACEGFITRSRPYPRPAPGKTEIAETSVKWDGIGTPWDRPGRPPERAPLRGLAPPHHRLDV